MLAAHWRLGLTLSLGTAIMWGFLPVSLAPLVTKLDIYTITFYRLFGGAVILLAWLLLRKAPFTRVEMKRSTVLFMTLAVLGLAGNYFFWLKGLALTTPATAQVVIQLAPMLLLLGGIFIFKEHFSKVQVVGVCLFLTGLGLFFNNRIAELLGDFGDYALGVYFVILASVTWAVYALAQKQLLTQFRALEVIFYIVLLSSFLFLPFAHLSSVSILNSFEWGMLLFAVANTALAYGFFTSAMHHWPASRVSAVIATVPLFTLIISHLQSVYFPELIPPEQINTLGMVGAMILVCGSAITALAKGAPVSPVSPAKKL